MTNSRCFRIDLKLNRFVACTKCNPTKILSAIQILEELESPDSTNSHRLFRTMLNQLNPEGIRIES